MLRDTTLLAHRKRRMRRSMLRNGEDRAVLLGGKPFGGRLGNDTALRPYRPVFSYPGLSWAGTCGTRFRHSL